MVAWWESLTGLERIFAYAALPSTVLLLVQTLLLMTGAVGHHDGDVGMHSDTSGLADAHGGAEALDHDGLPDTHADFAHDIHDAYDAHDIHDAHNAHDGHEGHDPGLRICTVRGLIAFFSVGGWTGLTLLRGQANALVSSVAAVLAGLLAMVVLASLFKVALKLQSDGSMDLRNAMGATGTVYLTVPAGRNAKGKVTVMFQDQLREVDAVTDGDAALQTGMSVRVVDVLGSDTLVVAEATKTAASVAT
jgi:hypothetical protein